MVKASEQTLKLLDYNHDIWDDDRRYTTLVHEDLFCIDGMILDRKTYQVKENKYIDYIIYNGVVLGITETDINEETLKRE